jgi:galactokinase
MIEKIKNGWLDHEFARLYEPGGEAAAKQRARYADALENFAMLYGDDRDVSIYSAPGRVELCGNHTDHNNGVVMAAAVNMDIIAVASKSESGAIRLRSRGFPEEDVVALSSLAPDPPEAGRSSAIIRGIASAFAERGVCGAFDAYTTSDVLKGSGLSSSAAFEVCVGTIINGEFNGGSFGAVELGLIGQFAENKFFGKPSGLMDQTTCSVGGAVSIDFENPASPKVESVPLDLASHEISLVVTDTKGDHSGLTDEYAAIRSDMESAAAVFGKRCLREIEYVDFKARIPEVRRMAGDRAVVRAIHFFEECGRVREAIEAVKSGDIAKWLALMIECGHSSCEFNQNAYSVKSPESQGISVGLAISQGILRGRGAWRLQGGGFAGTIQAFVPNDMLGEYRRALGGVFGADACHVLRIRQAGGVRVAL